MSPMFSACNVFGFKTILVKNLRKGPNRFKLCVNVMNRLFSHQALPKNCTFLPFKEVIKCRRAETSRSILVQVQSPQSHKELYAYCSVMGNVKNMLHYTAGTEALNFIIVEFEKESDVTNILSSVSFVDDSQIVPVQSPFMWFRAPRHKSPKLKQAKNVKLHATNGTIVQAEQEIKEALQQCSNISEQMTTLHDITKLNDLGTRLRFLTSRQIERAVSGMFPNAVAFPFGSSVNGFGKMGCDLDLVLRLGNEIQVSEENRLVFHCKAATSSERSTAQRQMESVGDLLQLFLPGCSQVRRILQARVPIIKYYQQLTDVECDLSMSNMSGVYMSDLLHIYGSIDGRVRPLVFTIKKWASEVALTSNFPGRWVTNFSLTLLVLAFLQKPITSPPVLPSVNTLIKNAGPDDKYFTEDGTNCTFLRDIRKLNYQTTNTENLESLLQQFFEYYSQFDFASMAVCLNEGQPIPKPEHSALYIVNPLERGLNVSKNVSLEELERLRVEVRNAAWILESQENKTPSWGILSVFESKKRHSTVSFMSPSQQGRLMEISALFEGDSPENVQTVDYKNINVKQQIGAIRKDTKQRIKLLENDKNLKNKRKLPT